MIVAGGVLGALAGAFLGVTTAHLRGMPLQQETSPAASESTPGRFRVVYTLTGGPDGGNPYSGLIQDAGGNLYGTSTTGGDVNCDFGTGCGTVFKLSAAGRETVLYRFRGLADGRYPNGPLLAGAGGNLYGTTSGGGEYNCGVVFKLDTSGKIHLLHTFTCGADGATPDAGVIRDPGGNLYGTTEQGGAFGWGTVFSLDPSGQMTVIYSFTGGTDGRIAVGELVRDGAGNLYGATNEGGDLSCAPHENFGCGTVYQIDPSGAEKALHAISGFADGYGPCARLIRDPARNLYATAEGGAGHDGVVFKVDPAGRYTLLHAFMGPDGDDPRSGLVRDPAGNLYGATTDGGIGKGVVFRLAVGGQVTVLHSFTGGDDGQQPQSNLLLGRAGDLFGTAPFGGAYGRGTVYAIHLR